MEATKDVLIRGVPRDVHRKLKIQCAVENVTLREKVIQLLKDATANTNIQGIAGTTKPLKAGSK